MFVQRLVRLDRLSEVHVQSVFKLQLEVRETDTAAAAACSLEPSGRFGQNASLFGA